MSPDFSNTSGPDTSISQTFVADVATRLAARRAKHGSATPAPAAAATPPLSGYMEAAAVLSWYDPEAIRSTDGKLDKHARDDLLVASVRVSDTSGIPRWALAPDKRIEALRQLRQSGGLKTAVLANQGPDDRQQRMLTAFLTDKPPSVETLNLEDLSALYQVCGWLSAAGFDGLPTTESIALRSDRLSLLQPFQHLAGEGFRGRKAELATLRKYVGVLPPSSTLESVQRAVESFFNFKSKPPLLVVGPGGAGKSTLIARFILEHAQAQLEERFPFIYLDFDRPEVTARPLSLLSEALRQIGIEYPHAREACELVRRRWLDDIAKADQRSADHSRFTTPNAASDTTEAAIRDFAKLIETLGGADRPVVFILDTFEEVQWSSSDLVQDVWELLEKLQAQVPRLRVIFVGRSEIADAKTEDLPLTGLDTEAAIGFLQHYGVTDADIARRIVKQVGGSPLSLKLAAEIVSKDDESKDGDLKIATREYWFFKLDSGVIQRQLYRRILGHLHEDHVDELAHPGLVLRRLTRELIEQVLMQPCGIPATVSSADLFNRLKREVSLVKPDGSDAIRHRDELRHLMLKLIYDDKPEQARAINERAVAWYAAREFDAKERAEEIYHRLILDQDFEIIDARWDPAVQRFLKNAMWEFEGRRKAYLARRLKITVDKQTQESAALEDWERLIVPQATRLLASGNFEDALKLLGERQARTAASPLFSLEAQAHARAGRPRDALAVLQKGFVLASDGGESRQALSLALQSSEIAYSFNLEAEAQVYLAHLDGFGEQFGSLIDRLNLATRRVAMATLLAGPDLRVLRQKMITAFDALPAGDLAAHPTSAFWCGAMLDPGEETAASSKVLAHIFAVNGLPRGSPSDIRRLAAEIATFDAGQIRAGALAEMFNVPATETRTQGWTTFLLDEPDLTVGIAISTILQIEPAADHLVEAAILLLRTTLGIQQHAAPQNSAAPTATRNLKATGEEQKAFADSVIAAFTLDELREIIRFRLHRSLEFISISSPFRTIVFELVSTAARENWLGDLVATLLDARPNNIDLARAADALGISTLASQGLSSLESSANNGGVAADATTFVSRLSEMQGWVCRIEVAEHLVATGILVGRDVILTTDHSLEALGPGTTAAENVTIRFDHRVTQEGEVVSEGATFFLHSSWLMARDAGLDYALLRVRNSPGTSPVGTGEGQQAESTARARGWFDISQPPAEPDPALPVLIVQNHSRGSLSLIGGKIIGINGPEFSCDAQMQPGSSGAPILSIQMSGTSADPATELRLIGMNLRAGPNDAGSIGTSISAIVRDLDSKAVLNTMAPKLA